MLKFPTNLASMNKIQYDFYLELNLARMISTKQKNVFTAIYEYRLHGTQPQRRRREFAYKFQIQYRNIKRNKQQNTFQFYPLQHPLQISGKTDFCQATRKVYGSRLNKPLSERVTMAVVRTLHMRARVVILQHLKHSRRPEVSYPLL